MNRRRFLAGTVAALSIGGMSNRSVTARQEDRPVLRVLGGSQYFSGSLVDAFIEETGVSIEVTPTANPDDVPLFLRAGGVGLYDLALTTNGLVQVLGESGLTQPVSASDLPNLANLFLQFQEPSWAMIDGNQFGVPVLWGSLAAAYAVGAGIDPPGTWMDLFDDRFKKQIIMSDDVLGHFWIWGRANGAADPTRVTREQLQSTTDLLIRLKLEHARSLESSVYNGMRKMAGGRGYVTSVGWQTASLISAKNETQLAATQPGPGSASFCDAVALVTDAPNREIAVQLINYFLAIENQADLANSMNWATVAPGAVDLIRPDLRGLFDYSDLDRVFSVSPVYGYPPISETPEGYATYLDWIVSWDQVRTAKR